MRNKSIFQIIVLIMMLSAVGCSDNDLPPVVSPVLGVISSQATPTVLYLKIATIPATPFPTAIPVRLTDIDASKVILNPSDLPAGFMLWNKFEGGQEKMQTALSFANRYDQAGHPILDNATLDASVALKYLQQGEYDGYYGLDNPLQFLSCGVFIYKDEPFAEQAYHALSDGTKGEVLNFLTLGYESSGYTFTYPLDVAKMFGIPRHWLDGMVRMGVDSKSLPQTVYGTRIIWRYREAVLHIITLSSEKIPPEKILALASLMQSRIVGN